MLNNLAESRNFASFNDDDNRVLIRLGLTQSQAKIYLTILSFRKAVAKAIAKAAHMDRAETYRIIRALEEQGFVERIIANPCEFRAIALSVVITHLLEKQKSAILKIEGEANLLLEKERTCSNNLEDNDDILILVPKPEMILDQIAEYGKKYESKIEMIDTLSSLGEIESIYEKEALGGLERGIKVTYITEKPSKTNPLPEVLKRYLSNPNFTLRYVDEAPKNRIIIEDGKRIWIFLEGKKFLDAKQLVSTNPCLISLVQSYFNYVKGTSKVYSHR
jgi:sugar-specific transcriptional regulator TrmB